MKGSRPVVDAQNLTRTFETPAGPVHALRSASLRVEAGEFVSVMGPSGSGKSTLLHQLGLMDRPSSGRLLLAGRDVNGLSARERDRARSEIVGFVFQSFHLIEHLSASDNAGLPLVYRGTRRRQRHQSAMGVLDQVGLTARAEAKPSTLSGGEKQRVAIARALITGPELILCDEPTGNLDTHNAAEVMRNLVMLREQGRAVLVITHDPTVAAVADTRYEMVDGRLSTTHDRGVSSYA